MDRIEEEMKGEFIDILLTVKNLMKSEGWLESAFGGN